MKGHDKLVPLDELDALGRELRDVGRTVVHCHGCFDIVHPGHVRYLRYARQQGDVLVVSLTSDDAIEKADGTRPHIAQEHRAENLAELCCVDYVVIADGPTAGPVIDELRPALYVKGREYESSSDPRFAAERALVERHGGRVLFSSGDVVFSSSSFICDITTRPRDERSDAEARLSASCRRWGVDRWTLEALVRDGFVGRRVAVIGDSLCDRYTFCDSTEIADEAPVPAVRPRREVSYLGGAAVIAAHLRAMGAEAHLVTTVADDEPSRQLLASLERQRIAVDALTTHHALPVKQRYLVEHHKLLKVDKGESQPLDSRQQRELIGRVASLCGGLDAVIVTDFGYGTVTPGLLNELLPVIRPRVPLIAADVSGARQTLLACGDVDLLAPSEHELRGVMGEPDGSLPTVAAHMMSRLSVSKMIVSMGRRGAVLFHPREQEKAKWFASRLRSDYLPALADHAVDALGAGDAMLSAAVLSLSAGATLPQAGYIASLAAAVAVRRVGNVPVSAGDLLTLAESRPELADATSHVPLPVTSGARAGAGPAPARRMGTPSSTAG